jgi:hypothetical protein
MQFVPFITSSSFKVTKTRGSPLTTESAGNMDLQDVLATYLAKVRITEIIAKNGPGSSAIDDYVMNYHFFIIAGC